VHLPSDFSRIYILAGALPLAMIHLFLDASTASSGGGLIYVRKVVPHLAARADLRSTILISPRSAEFSWKQHLEQIVSIAEALLQGKTYAVV